MKINKWIIVVIIVLLITILLLSTIKIKVYKYNVNVGDRIGFNIDNDQFNFGTVVDGTKSERFLIIKNDEHDMRVTVKAYGDLADKLSISENSFKIKKGEEKSLSIIMNINESLEKKQYQGKIIFISTIF